jgi:hypothetical protein
MARLGCPLPHLTALVQLTASDMKELGGTVSDRLVLDVVEEAIQEAEAAGVRP